ncbi:SHOCT domain-containing protein [Glycomyces mayteni]|uniref:SHOCT domain-containing protein n=1 Tax=Glycomyces mayteni TaxID=543887 RepID=A0ABW2D5B1_9ACTN|nr:hypothetical protein GCM10025732_29650 [Glycomyces mayteni]
MADGDLRPDIARAQALMSSKFGIKRELRDLPGHLWDGETVERIAAVQYAGATGVLVATDRRLLLVAHKIQAGVSEDFPYDKISSVQWTSKVASGVISVFASGTKAEVKAMFKNDGKAIADYARGRISERSALPRPNAAASAHEPPVDPASVENTSGATMLDQLARLGELHTSGVLTDEEFAAKKAELLKRL